uniref:Activator of Hsp90 ATPase homologue 1/2-like C-terminal domain-containing protein n=1 Tax=Strombidium inclinatum TaxID=197538 RepID=A0A7S3MYQ1_9SPIT|mmetsp:Transcript_22382/g.34641  ORF Transcript_22382/g.34641 Transcript_22382/m.34641 type:complete len:147 (+) Transcript_22382:18-458(+)
MEGGGKPQSHKFSINFSVPAHIIYNTLTNQMEMCRLTQGQAVVEPKPQGKYSIYDGMIEGEFISVEENKSIKMKWRMKDWTDQWFSDVTITFLDIGSEATEVAISQENIPEYDRYSKFVHLDNLEGGWKQMVFKRIEQVFGYPIKN